MGAELEPLDIKRAEAATAIEAVIAFGILIVAEQETECRAVRVGANGPTDGTVGKPRNFKRAEPVRFDRAHRRIIYGDRDGRFNDVCARAGVVNPNAGEI